MTQLTDEQYFDLSDKVYEDKYLKPGQTIISDTGNDWIVINSVDDPSGLQGIAVVPLKDYQDMQSGKITKYPDVVFASRGSQMDNFGEFVKDWIETDIFEMGLGQKPEHYKEQGLTPNNTSQFRGYEDFVNETLKNNSIVDYSFTGHSLGGALAQYMAVLKDKKATTFAAAKAYRLLPAELQKLVDQGHFNSNIVDYRHSWDPVGHVPFGQIIGRQYMVPSGSSNIAIVGHMRGSFKDMFDKDGAMILDELLSGSIAGSEIALYKQLGQLGNLKTQWGSHGPMTENQEIFLDQSEAIAVLSNTSNIVQTSLEALMVIYECASNDAQELWTKTLTSAEGIGTHLSYSEVIDSLEKGTATESFIVREPQAKHEKKKSELREILDSYDQMLQKLTTSILKMAEQDKQIASALRTLT